ncbi:MAG: helix-turn-helix transcriptional regulator, partial [Anaerolineae bacterium]|nr:helix-turn-helix transcriptional regulator [Anaerolineae bacterium]
MDTKSLGQRIRQARERKGLSQEDLALAISKDQSAVSDYEIGKRKLAAFELPLFADALDVPITYFFGQEGIDDDIDAAILSYVHQLETVDEQQAVVEMVR